MKFSVIYSIDCIRDQRVSRFYPRNRRLWNRTEDDKCFDYDYLDGAWRKGHHAKLCATLTREQFDAFISDTCLCAENVETMGSLTFDGWMPAISFNTDDYEQGSILSAYVTPIPDVKPYGNEEKSLQNWNRVRKAVLRLYK